MLGDVDEAVQQGISKPALDPKVMEEMDDEYYKGMLFENQIPAVEAGGMALIQERVLSLSNATYKTSFPEDSQDIHHGDGIYQQV